MFDNPDKNESLYHAVLLYTKKVRLGTARFNKDGNFVENLDNELELKRLLEEHGTFKEIFHHIFDSADLGDVIAATKGMENVVKAISKVDFDFRIITVNDQEYPQTLRAVEGTTPVIYARGDIGLFERKGVAVVGTRRIFKENMHDAISEGADLIQRLVGKEYVIISGLAEGCDTLAHKKAIEFRGRTIAVLGKPLNDYFPRFNRSLQDKIAAEHLLVSQYPLGIRTFGSHFAHRNKTAASLASDGAVIIHSGDKGGTQYVINHCQNQGKPLYILENNLNKGFGWVSKARDYEHARIVRKNGNGGNK